MTRYFCLLICAVTLWGCKEEKEQPEPQATAPAKPELIFKSESYEKKTSLPCKDGCTKVNMTLPVAENMPVVADSINNKIFNTVRGIVYFGEKPTNGKNYEEIMASFIGAYDKMKKDFPKDPMVPWEAKINAEVAYKSDSIINIKINHYTFTGGAHGYAGDRSLLFNARTGRSLTYGDIFKDEKGFTVLAEKKFREKFKIVSGKSINSTGLMFENDKFILPQNIFFTKDGLLLYYNAYEIASYAEQQKELLLPYSEVEQFLKMK